MRFTLLAAASILAMSVTAPAFAKSAEDAAYDKNKGPVIDTRGNCVRTKWQDAKDPCAVEVPAPKPVVRAPKPAAPVIAREARTIYFDFNKTSLTAESTAKLDELVKVINSSSAITDVTIHGFTDQLGTTSYNDALANKRVAAVKTYLDGKSRIAAEGDIKGLGKSSPEEGCADLKRIEKIACMAKERRVEIVFNAQQ
jgi:outer membrane protein OmpA-like peptidoglycan-associated protein